MAPIEVKIGYRMVKVALTHKDIKPIFYVALFTLPRQTAVVNVLMASFTIVKCQARKLLKFLTIFCGSLVAFLAIYH